MNATVQNNPNEQTKTQGFPVQPTGSAQKETGPVGQVSEFVKPTEVAPQIHPEVREAGVVESPNPQTPKLTLEDKKAGLGLAKESTPVITEPTGLVNLPFDQTDVQKSKSRSWTDALKWIVMMGFRQMKMKKA